jgi:hypothetical protein
MQPYLKIEIVYSEAKEYIHLIMRPLVIADKRRISNIPKADSLKEFVDESDKS